MKTKVTFVYNDSDGKAKMETLWAIKSGDHYIVDNIPFYIKNIAYRDTISVERDDGELYFESLLQPSGHSTIQLLLSKGNEADVVGKEFINLGCDWEGSHKKDLIAIDVPKDIPYQQVKTYLDDGERSGRWDYREACLGWK